MYVSYNLVEPSAKRDLVRQWDIYIDCYFAEMILTRNIIVFSDAVAKYRAGDGAVGCEATAGVRKR